MPKAAPQQDNCLPSSVDIKSTSAPTFLLGMPHCSNACPTSKGCWACQASLWQPTKYSLALFLSARLLALYTTATHKPYSRECRLAPTPVVAEVDSEGELWALQACLGQPHKKKSRSRFPSLWTLQQDSSHLTPEIGTGITCFSHLSALTGKSSSVLLRPRLAFFAS